MQPRHLISFAVLFGTACSDSGAHPLDASTGSGPDDASMVRLDSGSDAHLDAGALRDADVSVCAIPADCLAVRSAVFTLEPCCDRTIGCGYDYATDAGLPREALYVPLGIPLDARCFAAEKLFHSGPTSESQRVALADGGQVLVSATCPTAFITSFSFSGCCLPSNQCALSTYPIQAELGVLAGGPDWPFSKIECVTSDELNAQLRSSPLAGFGKLPETSGSCDYAELDRTLAPATP